MYKINLSEKNLIKLEERLFKEAYHILKMILEKIKQLY